MINVKLTDGAGKSYYLGGCIPENGVDFDLMSGIENLSLICLKFYENFKKPLDKLVVLWYNIV